MNSLKLSFEGKKEFPLSKRQMLEEKIRQENIGNNLVFCIDRQKTFSFTSV